MKKFYIYIKPCLKEQHELFCNLCVILLFLLSIYIFLMDITYVWNINCCFLLISSYWLESIFANMGFIRDNAFDLIKSSFGVVFTIVSIVLNLGTNLFNRSEFKIFGISYRDLQDDEAFMIKFFQKIGPIFPLISIIAINLELCGTGYMMLLCSYFLVCCNYIIIKKSYDKKWQRDRVISKLLGTVEREKNCIDNNMVEFDRILDDIRSGIKKTEGWNNAWLLFDNFLEKIKEYDNEKCFICVCHFLEILLSVGSEENVDEQLIYVKKYISKMKLVYNDSSKEDIIYWSLLCSVVLQWNQETMIKFIEWFADISRRSSQRVLMGIGELQINELQKQIGIFLFILEYWLNIESTYVSIGYECVDKVYYYGAEFLKRKDIEDEVIGLMEILAELYEKKYGSEIWEIYDVFDTLRMDVKFGFNNSLLVTKLKYEL